MPWFTVSHVPGAFFRDDCIRYIKAGLAIDGSSTISNLLVTLDGMHVITEKACRIAAGLCDFGLLL